MRKLIIVCGQTGVGKTTYSNKLAKEINAIKFSIDPWMQILFSKEMKTLDFSWMMERVERCQVQIWEVSEQILKNEGNVILDLGFTTKSQRNIFIEKSKEIGVNPEVHYLEASYKIRKQRVEKRNSDKDPNVYVFEVTDQMFEFMEPRFEVPDHIELENGKIIQNI